MTSRLIILILGLTLFSFSCNDSEVSDCLPPENWFNIDLQDENEMSLFNSVYLQDSIILYSNTDTIPLLWWVSEEKMQIGFELINQSEDYFLELSSSDTDTLWIQWSSTGELCKNYFLDSMRYNNTAIAADELISNDLTLIKK